MATRSGKRRTDPASAVKVPNPIDPVEVERVSGWTSEEFDLLMSEYSVPEKWNGIPCVALMEAIRNRIDSSDKSYKEEFPKILKALNLKIPAHLVGLLQKIKRAVVKAQKTNNIISLSAECVGLSMKSAPQIGPYCKENGISPESLLKGSTTEKKSQLTNAMVIELYRFREKSDATWQTVVDVWWPNIFGTDSPPLGTVQSNWRTLNQKCQQLRQAALSEFLSTLYSIPTPKHTSEVASTDEEDVSDDDSDVEFYPDFISGETLDHMGDCMEYLTDLWHEEVISHGETIAEAKKTNKTVGKLERALEEANKINAGLKKEVRSLSKKNVARRLESREADLEVTEKELEDEKKETQKLNKKIQKLEERVQALQKDKKGKGDSRRHFRLSSEKNKSAAKEFKKQVKLLECENEDLKCQLDEIMEDREITSFENGKYTDSIRLTCFELIARGVSSRNVSDIIRVVLRDVGKMKVGRLPKPTLIRYLCVEQAMLNKEAARSKMASSENPVTLQLDGTTKKRKGYTTFLASTDEGTVGLSLHDISTESAETLLKETEDTLDELLTLQVNKDKQQVLDLLAKIKNTMTDRCVVNKAYISKLEKWRASALPQVIEDWENIDDDLKQELSTINDMYCGKHLVLNMQEYASAALNEWERIEAGDEKLGREKKVLWNRGKGESASLLTVRTFCNFLGPDCDEQSGMVEEFKSIVSTSHLMAYRGNRFNVPFHNSAAVYYHKDDFYALCSTLDQKREENMFVRCLKADLQDEIVLAGIRAMGIIGQHISTPVMQMVESNLHIMDTDKYYSRLHQKLQDWMIDPTPLVNDSTILYENFPPVENDLHKSLYQPTTANIEHLTKQALSIILHNVFVCVSRQVEDHLPGGRFHNANAQLRKEATTCPKDNLAAERVFAGLDRLRRIMPSANTLSFEGILLWSLNKTRPYLDNMDEAERSKFIADARKYRTSYLKLYHRKSSAIKKVCEERMKQNKEKKEAKQRLLTRQAAENTSNALEICGKICTDQKDVDGLIEEMDKKKLEQALISQIKHWKTACKGGVRKDLFYLTSKSKKLTAQDLETNLRIIIKQIMNKDDDSETPSTSGVQHQDKQRQKDELKKKLLAKMSPTKKRRKGPFPGDRIIQKRIRHSFIDSEGGALIECKGLVVRKATEEDIEELVEPGDRKNISVYTFYTIMYDPPYEELLCYPLEKEWNEGTLDLM